jgi:very-short-patch-repair endonuclease
MRNQLLKLSRISTKTERRVSEIFKKNRIKFQFRKKIGPYEADFVVGKVIFEIDGNVHKNIKIERDVYFANQGYIPIHLSIRIDTNMEEVEETIINLIKQNNGKRKRKNIIWLDRAYRC